MITLKTPENSRDAVENINKKTNVTIYKSHKPICYSHLIIENVWNVESETFCFKKKKMNGTSKES